MATIERPATYAVPGTPDSIVEVLPRYDNFIGGRWVAPVKGGYKANLTPVTGKPFTEVPESTPEDVELALDAAHAARQAWGETSTTERSRVLNRVADAIEEHRRVWRSPRAGRTESRSARRSRPTSRSRPITSATSRR